MRQRLIATAVGLLAIGLLAGTGCGGGGDSNTVSISKAEFVKAADVTCKEAADQIQSDYLVFLKKHAKVTSPTEAEYAELVSTVFVPNVEKEVAELRALGAPTGDEEEIGAFIDARQESIQIAEGNPRMLLNEGAKVTAKSARLAKEYGLESCGNP